MCSDEGDSITLTAAISAGIFIAITALVTLAYAYSIGRAPQKYGRNAAASHSLYTIGDDDEQPATEKRPQHMERIELQDMSGDDEDALVLDSQNSQ